MVKPKKVAFGEERGERVGRFGQPRLTAQDKMSEVDKIKKEFETEFRATTASAFSRHDTR